MAVVAGLLAMFLFGIVVFGLTLSFDQSLTQAANEAARAAAVAPREDIFDETPSVRARAAADRVASGWDAACDDGQGLTCTFRIAPCSNGTEMVECMTVDLRYDLANNPRGLDVPLVSGFLPDELSATVVVAVESASTP